MALWVSCVVLFTITMNATALGPLMVALGLNKTTPLQRKMHRSAPGGLCLCQRLQPHTLTALVQALACILSVATPCLPQPTCSSFASVCPGARMLLCVSTRVRPLLSCAVMMMRCSRGWTGGQWTQQQTYSTTHNRSGTAHTQVSLYHLRKHVHVTVAAVIHWSVLPGETQQFVPCLLHCHWQQQALRPAANAQRPDMISRRIILWPLFSGAQVRLHQA